MKKLEAIETQQPAFSDFFDKSLNAYMKDLSRISLELDRCPKDSERIFGDFKTTTDRVLSEGEALLGGVKDRLTAKQVKGRFRDVLKEWLHNGSLTERAARRPRGYPGDYQTIDLFYDNAVTSNGMAGFWDRYLLSLGYVQAVRDRKDHMKGLLKKYFSKNTKNDLQVLNLGSGSCRELRETPREVLGSKKGLRFTLLDQDQSSLDFSKEELKRTHPGVNFRFVQGNVVDYARRADQYRQKLGEQDLIYSIGLADYIPDGFLGGMIATSFTLLKPGGSIMVAHKNLVLHKSLASDWFCDWTFIPRTADDLQSMIREHLKDKAYEMKLDYVGDGHIYYVTIDKK